MTADDDAEEDVAADDDENEDADFVDDDVDEDILVWAKKSVFGIAEKAVLDVVFDAIVAGFKVVFFFELERAGFGLWLVFVFEVVLLLTPLSQFESFLFQSGLPNLCGFQL